MAKPNYAFQKRQRELAKKQKKEEKKKQKMGAGEPVADPSAPAPEAPATESKDPT